jgi:type IV secretory pathway component VirB8
MQQGQDSTTLMMIRFKVTEKNDERKNMSKLWKVIIAWIYVLVG